MANHAGRLGSVGRLLLLACCVCCPFICMAVCCLWKYFRFCPFGRFWSSFCLYSLVVGFSDRPPPPAITRPCPYILWLLLLLLFDVERLYMFWMFSSLFGDVVCFVECFGVSFSSLFNLRSITAYTRQTLCMATHKRYVKFYWVLFRFSGMCWPFHPHFLCICRADTSYPLSSQNIFLGFFFFAHKAFPWYRVIDYCG